MSLPFELVALDLDMTLLDSEHRISARNLAAVRQVVALGVKVVITSGRMYRSTLPYLQQMELDTPIVCYNGAMIKDAHSGEVLWHKHLRAATAQELVEFCDREGLNLNYYLDDNLYIANVNPWAELYSQRTGAPLNPVGDLRIFADRGPTKALIVADPKRILELRDELTPEYADRAYVTISNVEYLEFMPPGVDKGKALAFLAAHLGIEREKVIAFGDAGNDLPLIAWAGLGVAMENAKPETKAVAGRIAPHHEADGVAVVLEDIYGLTPAMR